MPASGGAELSMYTLIKELSLLGMNFHIITKSTTNNSNDYDTNDNNIIVHRIENKWEIEDIFNKLRSCIRIDGVITQNSWSEVAIKISHKYNYQSFYFLRSPFGELDISNDGEYSCDFIIANSLTTQKYIERKFLRFDSIIVPPLINPNEYLVESNSKEFITMINPIQMKGGEIFKEIAKALPNRKFLAVKGWTHLMKNNDWDLPLINDLSIGLGMSENPLFAITEFEGISNVTVQDSTTDMKIIYSKTKILLVPSITPEGGPRVAIEAMINGIPVIGSKSGNTPLTIGEGGIVISNLFNISEWVSSILKFDNDEYYEEISQKAKVRYKLDVKCQISSFINLLINPNAKS